MSLKCSVCGSIDISRKGFRKNKSGKKQKYQCYDCKKWFVEDDGFKGMRFKPKVIVRAIHMHEDGMSLSKVQNHLWQHDNTKVTRWAVSLWIKRYSNFLKSAPPKSRAKAQRKTAFG